MITIKRMKRFLPKPLIKILRLPYHKIVKPAYYYIIDTYEIILSRKDELKPPRKMIFVGDGNFKQVGEEFLQLFKNLCNIEPSDRILDVGCGIGRMAIPLTKYLGESGSYEGFDIVDSGIEWCKKNISTKYPNFKFQLADIYNKSYNPSGIYKSSEYKFPFHNDDFDFVFATSVFTHMLSQDVENYVSEISRVIRNDAKFLITFFILNSESLTLLNQGKGDLSFNFDIDPNSMTISKENPEDAIAYNEAYIFYIFSKYNLNIERIHYGSWCNRKNFLSYQDIIVGKKNSVVDLKPSNHQ